MIFGVEISEQANNDLRGIFEYIIFQLNAPRNAASQIDRLEEQILSLDQCPERFHLYNKEPWKTRGLRIMPIDNYLVMYIADNQRQIVTVIRVMYGGRDVDAQLERYTE
ncbi:MAG: type II toxin-antitoxin system RelE/ParE family toxin [Clostridiales Family XIII bacterium]|jgi:addiction module RelE/StbE family toxin|nr:type II toxin-antitoxin system RelE/ParE family toxin [Clostridiales Family XIII bacterium]